jgi:hypothetical protein
MISFENYKEFCTIQTSPLSKMPQNPLVTNISSIPNTSLPNTLTLLGNGVRHIPQPRPLTLTEFTQSVNILKRRLEIKTWVNERAMEEGYWNPNLRIDPSTWRPTLETHKQTQINSFIENLQSQFSYFPAKNRILSTCKAELEQFDICVTLSDKNLGFVLMDLKHYHNLCLIHLNSNTYKYIGMKEDFMNQFNPLQKEKDFVETIMKYPAFQELTKQEKKFILQLKERSIPAFHILPKIHKSPLQGRPIAGATNWITTQTSKLLDVFLQPKVARGKHILKNSKQLCDDLLSNPIQLQESTMLVSFDVVALYPNIHIPTLRNLLATEDIFMLKMLDFILEQNYVDYCERIFKQTEGIPMGTNCAVNLANWYLLKLIDENFISHPHIHYFRRYIDDLFFFWTGTEGELLEFFNLCNNQKSWNINFTMKSSTSQLEVLDIEIYKLKPFNTVSFRLYQKTMNNYQYLTAWSHHPTHTKRAFIIGELRRYATNSSHPLDFNKMRDLLITRCIKRGYSITWLRKICAEVAWTDRFRNKRIQTSNCLFFNIRYTNRSIFSKMRFHLKGKSVNQIPIKLSYNKSKNLTDIFCHSKLNQNQIDSLTNTFGNTLGLQNQTGLRHQDNL